MGVDCHARRWIAASALVAVGHVYPVNTRPRRVARVTLGVVTAGWCASALGGPPLVVVLFSFAFGTILIVCEHFIGPVNPASVHARLNAYGLGLRNAPSSVR